MDRKLGILNVGISILSRVILLVSALFVRRLLIRCIGNEVNGLNSLYSSIIGMLTVAELGVGNAIVFSMYRPIVAGDKRRVAALYCLYKKLYRIIGAVIFVAGLLVIPFLPYLVSDYESVNVNVYVTFLLTLVAVVLTYMYSAKTSLIVAHKNNYITTSIMTIARLIEYVLQAAAIYILRSYVAYLVCHIIETLIVWGLTEGAVRRLHGEIIVMNESVDPGTKSEIVRNIKAMFMHKIGTILVNSIDSMIISVFVGVVALGKYSNYALIASVMSGTLSLFFSPLTSIVGHLCAKGDSQRIKKYFQRFYNLNYILGTIFFLGYYVFVDEAVAICFEGGLKISRSVVFIITLNQFIQFMRHAALLFRDASGAFYYDRWKPVAEGVVNLTLSLIFVKTFPADYRVVGVIAATIITNLLICHIVEPYVLFKHVLKESCWGFYVKNYALIALFVSVLLWSPS